MSPPTPTWSNEFECIQCNCLPRWAIYSLPCSNFLEQTIHKVILVILPILASASLQCLRFTKRLWPFSESLEPFWGRRGAVFMPQSTDLVPLWLYLPPAIIVLSRLFKLHIFLDNFLMLIQNLISNQVSEARTYVSLKSLDVINWFREHKMAKNCRKKYFTEWKFVLCKFRFDMTLKIIAHVMI